MRQPAVATTTDHGTRDHEPGNPELWPSKGTHKPGVGPEPLPGPPPGAVTVSPFPIFFPMGFPQGVFSPSRAVAPPLEIGFESPGPIEHSPATGGDRDADAENHCPKSCPKCSPETPKPALYAGFRQYRYGDSNPGFRTENPAS